MTDLKYIVNPYLMEDEEESVKEDKPVNNGMLMKKMEKLFFEKVEEHLLTPSYLKFINKQTWYNDTLSKITDFPA
jgi:hypothetical protein